ncbi:MAG: aldehyde dehydrogenase family protein, partial [Planctomycetota bacterium]|nr:aldehyde dehydrogenase family protein [Planctomycetota bacterium]
MQDRNLIGGQWRSAHSGETFAVCDAATGEELARVPQCGALEASDAIEAAEKALQAWSGLTPSTRATVLTAIAQAMRDRKQEFAQNITA